jgi:hypothetical protein
MHDKKHIVCKLCNEPHCLEEDCFFHTYPHKIAQRMKRFTRDIKSLTPGNKNSPHVTKCLIPGDKNPPGANNSLIDFRYIPAYFRGGKKNKEVMIKQEKRYIVCYLCDEPKCLEDECLFLTDPRDITRGMKNYVSFIDIPFASAEVKETPGGKAKDTPLNFLYLNGLKLFWFCVVIGGIMYLLVFGGLPFLSTAFFSMQSQLPLQVYIAIFGAGVTIVCLVMANLFGTESTTAK